MVPFMVVDSYRLAAAFIKSKSPSEVNESQDPTCNPDDAARAGRLHLQALAKAQAIAFKVLLSVSC